VLGLDRPRWLRRASVARSVKPRFITILLLTRSLAVAALVTLVTTEANSAPWTRQADEVRGAMLSSDPVSRRRASARLSQLDRAVARELTLMALRDSDPIVRLHAIDAAGRLQLQGARQFALQWLSDPDPRLRQASARLIAELPEASDVPILGRTLSDGDPTVRALAAEALGRTGSATAVPALLGQLDDQRPRVRVAITRSLGWLRDRRAVAALMGRLHDADGLVREAAALALAEIGDQRAIGPVTLVLYDSEPNARAAAAAALGDLAAVSTVGELERVGASDVAPSVRAAAFVAMGRFQSAPGNEALLRALSREARSETRNRGAGEDRAAVLLGFAAAGSTATPLLRECVAEGSRRSQLCARAWASAAPHTSAVPIAEAMAARQIPAVVGLELLEALASPDATPAVIQQLERGVVSERARAILVLDATMRENGPDGRIARPLAAMLKRAPNSAERAALIQLLGRAGNPSVAETIASFTAMRWDAAVRRAAYAALFDLYRASPDETRAAIGSAAFDAILLSGLRDPEPSVRETASLVVADAGSGALVEPVMALYSASATSDRLLLAASLRGPLRASPSTQSLELAVRHLSHSRGRLRDAWLESLAPIPAAVPLIGRARLDDADRAKLAEGLGRKSGYQLRQLAGDRSSRVRANAVWRLGTVLPPSGPALEDMLRMLDDPDAAVSANAIAGVARLVRASGDAMEGSKRDLAITTLCDATIDGRSAVRANALAGLLLVGSACGPEQERVSRLLHRDPSARVRLLAAELLSGASGAHGRKQLLACAREDSNREVRATCLSLAEHPHRERDAEPPGPAMSVLVDVVPASGDGVVGNAPFGLRFADGLVRYGLVDRRGRVREPNAPRGSLTLMVPAPYQQD
jgi:HEAT repeat protein